ncbi:MAG: hypothetical protein H0W29_15445 [Gemmatimonadales bacterium]|nr:hypothetical protein [Gemmatimonadales bacterium]
MSGNGIGPEGLKRLRNLKAFWEPRMQAATSDAELAKICFDRAKAAARKAQKAGDQAAMHELAEQLAVWAAGKEQVAVKRGERNAA